MYKNAQENYEIQYKQRSIFLENEILSIYSEINEELLFYNLRKKLDKLLYSYAMLRGEFHELNKNHEQFWKVLDAFEVIISSMETEVSTAYGRKHLKEKKVYRDYLKAYQNFLIYELGTYFDLSKDERKKFNDMQDRWRKVKSVLE